MLLLSQQPQHYPLLSILLSSSFSGVNLQFSLWVFKEVLWVLQVRSRCPMSWVKLLKIFADQLVPSSFKPLLYLLSCCVSTSINILHGVFSAISFLCTAKVVVTPHRKTTRFGLTFSSVLFKEGILFPMSLLLKLIFVLLTFVKYIYLLINLINEGFLSKSNVDVKFQLNGFII